ncbi:M20 metallopeptidase family protein [Pyramidobacter sp.]|uniref:M20 metallopeptidase family protein n=1 Tax=Pyramidobacter sp. TaxID=1943581 RepID=UPI0025FAF3F6|nr:M20 family metallopeptidase [Pyramidobacter sp.]MCI7404050.1 M20 family metallopeptidase [Pyramidobacter sp.]MDY3212484.1 M20 family metallopeptidase [Pyramidobacter sp.]
MADRQDSVTRASEAAVALRREFHRHPELSWREVETTKKIAARMAELGVSVIKKGFKGTQCGLVAEIKGAKPGPTLMIRADIDALPVAEDPSHDVASECAGVMHACGHDAHAAILAGVVQVVQEHRDELCGAVRFLFQPAEEAGPGSGAPAVIADGALEGVDAIIGEHVQSQMPAGKIGWKKGPMMASADIWDIVIHGKGGHGASPHRAVNPMLCAAALVPALTAIAPQEVSALEPVVVGIGAIKAGEARNVIPDTCTMCGTVRCSDMETREAMPERFRRIVDGIAAAWNCTADLKYEKVYPVTVNDPDVTDWILDVAKAEGLEDRLVEREFAMGSEDFSYYGEKIPAAYFNLGMGTDAPHHSAEFRVDDAVVPLGVKLLSALALDYGKSRGK